VLLEVLWLVLKIALQVTLGLMYGGYHALSCEVPVLVVGALWRFCGINPVVKQLTCNF
jgi:hypothetical protein